MAFVILSLPPFPHVSFAVTASCVCGCVGSTHTEPVLGHISKVRQDPGLLCLALMSPLISDFSLGPSPSGSYLQIYFIGLLSLQASAHHCGVLLASYMAPYSDKHLLTRIMVSQNPGRLSLKFQ